ncbi:hypothetical protein [Thalassovita aquimarina]|uniref:Glycosyltransferase RgtA/B/C/D-like domain-containing protein n=1 Tax=Thalassovita aquimarina TaxID=2785917 RepID=A0ABS5HNW1_9RHOB|nr:hypothetical protein [Thalassovita aquimarina]MBR9650646.1 hypothetical protein [Thalassovita aquimarina]
MMRSGLPWLGALLLLLWPLFLYKGPIAFSDTKPYLNGAATGVRVVLGIEAGLVAEGMQSDPGGPVAAETAVETSPATKQDQSVSSARSPWFGGFLLGSVLLADGAGPALVQALVVLTVIALTARNVPGAGTSAPYLVMVLAAVTPLALYTDYMMPDLSAGVAILAVVNLMAFDARIGWGQRVVWAVLLTGTMLFHTSHVLVAGSLALVAAGLARLLTGRFPARGLITVLLAVLVFAAGQGSVTRLVERHYGAAPLRPPFLTARLVADGPGFDYLSSHCADPAFAICGFVDRMPAARLRARDAAWYSNVLLWSDDPHRGIYEAAGPDIRARLSQEQMRFAVAVLRHDPAGVIGAGLSNTVAQFFRWRVDEIGALQPVRFVDAPLIDPAPLLASLPGLSYEPVRLSRVYRISTGIALAAAALLLGVARHRGPAREAVALVILVLVGLMLNAAVTGGLSGVDDRYQSRVIWLLPFAVMLAGLAWARGLRDG